MELAKDAKGDCRSEDCQRRVAKCIMSMGDESQVGGLVRQAKGSRHRSSRELAIKALGVVAGGRGGGGGSGGVGPVEAFLMSVYTNDKLDPSQRMFALGSLLVGDVEEGLLSEIVGRLGSMDRKRDLEVACFAVQRLHGYFMSHRHR